MQQLEDRRMLAVLSDPSQGFATVEQPLAVGLGTFAGDANPDAVILGSDGDLTLAQRAADDNWQTIDLIDTGLGPQQTLITERLSPDPLTDVITQSADSISVLHSQTDGSFTVVQTLAAPSTAGFASSSGNTLAVDFVTSDSSRDLIVVASADDAVLIFPGLAGGTFDAPTTYTTGVATPTTAITGDFFGDRMPDLVVGHADGSLVFFEGSAQTDTLTRRDDLTLSESASIVSFGKGDFDLDGNLDLAVTTSTDSFLLFSSDDPQGSPVIVNGDFSAGLTGWETEVVGHTSDATPGRVNALGGAAQLRENGSFLTSIKQTLVIPAGATTVSFDLVALGLDPIANGVPDAFEVSLLDSNQQSLVPTHDPDSTAFYNVSAGNVPSLASGVSVNEDQVTLDLTALTGGTEATLVFDLIGNPPGNSSVATIDNVAVFPEVVHSDAFDRITLTQIAGAAVDSTVGDFDGDGNLDIVVADTSTETLIVFNGDGNRNFASDTIDLSTFGSGVSSLAGGPLTSADTVDDLIITLSDSNLALSPIGADVTAPTVSVLDPVDGSVLEAFTGSLTLQFSEPVRESGNGSVNNLDAYTFAAAGPDGLFDTIDDVEIPFESVVYDPVSLTAIVSVTAAALPLADDEYRITVNGTDATNSIRDLVGNAIGGGSDQQASFTLDALLSLDPAQDTVASEGDTISVLTTFNDPGRVGGYSASVDWGDGVAQTMTVTLNPDGFSGTLSADHVYADDASYDVTITLIDGNGEAIDVDSVSQISNALPVLSGLIDIAAAENSLTSFVDLALVTDAGFSSLTSEETFTATIDWGDGSALTVISDLSESVSGPTGPTTASISADHSFASEGIYDVTITVTDDDGGVAIGTLQAFVSNTAPILAPLSAIAAFEGDSVSVSGTYTDDDLTGSVDPATIHTVTIDWGDGTINTVNPTVITGNEAAFFGQHVYADDADYTVTVTVADSGTGAAMQSATASIAGIAPTIIAAADSSAAAGQLTTFALGSFSDPGFSNSSAGTTESFTVTVDWGDGSPIDNGANVVVTNGAPSIPTEGQISADHVYSSPGIYTVTTTVTDDDGLASTSTLTVTATGQVGSGTCLPSIDFDHDITGNALHAGTLVNDQWALWGVHITTDDPVNHPAMIFDSSAPTGGDTDLGSPHNDFGGPGVGSGGASGADGENANSLGKVLIISEDADSSDPDDDASGGTFIFTFDNPVRLDEIGLLDLDSGEESNITLFDLSGNLIATTMMTGLGNNAAQTIILNADNVARMEVELAGSGAITDLIFCRDLPSMTVFGDDTTAEGDPYDALLLSPGVTVSDWNITVTNSDGTYLSNTQILDSDSPTLSTIFPDGEDTYTITGWATDSANAFPIDPFSVTVANVDPTITISGAAEIDAQAEYTIDLSSVDPGNDTIIQWLVDWGDGNVETISGNPDNATHVYESTGTFNITASAFDEDNASLGGPEGLIVVEAEAFDDSSSGTGNAASSTWISNTDPNAAGGVYLLASPNDGVNTGDSTRGPRLDYNATFSQVGTYYVWVRMLGSTSRDDSLHIGLNGQAATYGKNGMTDSSGDWHWEQNVNNRDGADRVTIDVTSTGTHTLNLWMREDGTAVDKIILTTDPNYTPTDLGPEPIVAGDAYVSNTLQVTVDAGDNLWLPNVDFSVDGSGLRLDKGDRITDQFASLGFTVSTNDPNHPAMIFDSTNPSGGDTDLGSPNSQYGGPGLGSGGASNATPLGNVLIISEDDDATDPDDNGSGGTLIFDFDQIVMVDELGFLDVQSGDNRIDLFDADGNLISSTDIPDSGDNGYSRVAIDALGVARMEVHFDTSGAITDIEFCRDGGYIPATPTRFYVTDDGDDDVYRYDTGGESLGDFDASAAYNPRGITTTGEGNPVWVISEEGDDERVYVYDTDAETLLGDWNARILESPEGIATDGTDIWVIDDGIDKVKRFSDAASRTSGEQFASSEFQLAFGNSDPRGITTDGQTLWTVDAVSNKVFAYQMDGTFVNWWNLDPENDDPAGITINPAGGDGIWVVDATDNAVYHYANATLPYLGDQTAISNFGLSAGNTNPTGIADPATLINVGDTVAGTLADIAQVDEYEFTKGFAPVFIQVDSVSGGDIRLNYDDPSGTPTTGIFAAGEVTELTYFDPGTFTFSVSVGSGTPNYTVSLLEVPPASFDSINIGDTVIDSLDTAHATDIWEFNGSAGQTVSIDVAAENPDLVLDIFDPNGGGGLGGTSLYSGPFSDTGPISLSSTATYEISVSSISGSTTPYEFTLNGAALPSITLDTSIVGEILTEGQADAYVLAGTAGQTLNFDVINADLFTFSLVGPSGQTVFSDVMASFGTGGTTFNDQNEVLLPETGDYTVIVDSDGGEGFSTGPYEFIVSEPSITDTFINLGDSVVDSISTAGEVDRYTFTLSADQSFQLDFTSIAGGDLQASVSDDTNVLFTSPLSSVADDLDFSPQLTASGTYTIEVVGGGAQTPSYEFSLLDGGNLATELTNGSIISDQIANASEIDLYTFNAVAGDRVSVDFTSVSGGELSYELIAPDGSTVLTDSSIFSFILDFSDQLLDQSGMYSLRLMGADGDTPTYAFEFARATTNPGIGIMLGQSVSGQINPAFEVDQYTIDITAGQIFWLDFTSLNGADFDVTLTSPSGVQTTRTVSDTRDYDVSDPVTSSESGLWTLSIIGTSSLNTSYAFTVWDVDPTETTALDLDTLYQDSISSPGAIDIYNFDANTGDEYFFNFTEIGTGNLRIDLIAPDGSSAFTELTSFPSVADRRFALNQTGTYQLVLRGQDSSTPTYGFRITDIPEPTVQTLELDRVYQDTIEVPLAEDHFVFQGAPDQRIYIDVQSKPFGTSLTVQLVAPDGSVIYDEDDTIADFLDAGPFTVDQPGQYSVRFLDPNGGTTDYSFRVWDVAPDLNESLVFDQVYSGDIETPGKVDTYTFEGTAGQSIFLDMQQVFGSLRGVNETLISSITSPSGVSLAGAGNFLTSPHDAGVLELTETGSYTLTLSGAGDTIPGYQFQLNDVTPGVPTAIGVNQVVSDRIDAAGQIRQYTLSATAGTELILDVLLNRNVDPFIGEVIGWTVESPSGSVLVNKSEIDASFTAPETGTYTITVDNRDETRGKDTTEPFAFRIIDDPAAPAPQAANLVTSDVIVDSVIVGNPATVNVTWTVTNTGDITAAASAGGVWTDRVYFAADQNERGIYSIAQGDIDRLVDLAPGASYQQTASFTLPADFEGSFWVDVQADATNLVYEGENVEDNFDQAPLLTAVYTDQRQQASGPALNLTPEDGSVFPTGSQIALSGSATSTNESINAIFVIDVSRSTLEVKGLDANGDGVVNEDDNLNGDNSSADILDAEIGAALQLTDRLTELSDNVAVSTVIFAGGATIADQGPENFNQIFTDPATITTFRDDVTNFQQTLTSLRPDSVVDFRPDVILSGTSFNPPIRQVGQLLAGAQETDRTIVYFLTDGEAFDPTLVVDGVADQGIEFFAFQLGGTAVTTELNELTSLIDADPSSTGVAKAVIDINDLASELISTIEIQSVTVNGNPVTAIDAAGNFFAPITINAGANPVTVVATSASGATSETQITLFGDDASGIDFDSLLPAAAGITPAFNGTTFNRATNELHTSLAANNETSDLVTAPLVATLDNFSTPAVSPVNFTLPPGGSSGNEGRAGTIFTSDIPAATTSTFVDLTLSNPLRDRFDFDVNFEVTGNRTPAFSTTPILTATADQPYTAPVDGVDPDGDALTIELLQAPSGATLTGGVIQWLPTSVDIGHHSFLVKLSDGRGGTATQSYTVLVPTGLADAPPLFTSNPSQVGTVEELYTYDITALDPEGLPVTLTLENGPAGALIVDNQLQWTPAATDLGDFRVTILATDPAGNPGRQSFDLTIRPVNTAPEFQTDPVTDVAVGERYLYASLATDADDAVSYSITGPTGISVNETSGLVSWDPSLVVSGSYPITLTATDARGLSTDQPYTLVVSPDTAAPNVSIILSDSRVGIGEDYEVQVVASDNVAVASIELVIDGTPVTLDSDGRATVTPASAGVPTLIATATDIAGNVGTATDSLFVIDFSDVTPPTVEITSPVANATIEYLTDVFGTVTDDNLASYTLEVALINTGQWNTIGSASVPDDGTNIELNDEFIAVFDPTLLKNNQYELRLTATDTAGNTSSDIVRVSLDGNAKVGINEQPVVDLTIPVAGGPPIMIHRQHSQLTADESGDFGNGWSFCTAEPDLRESVARTQFEDFFGQFAAIPFSDGDKVYITTPDCQRVGFTFSPTPHTGIWTTLSDQYFDPRWIPDPGVDWQLYGESDFTRITSLSTGEFDLDGLPLPLLRLPSGEFILAAVNTAYNPLGYELVHKEGVRYSYDQESGLEQVVDRNGNTLDYTDDAITSSSGQQVQFQRDEFGRITSVLDPDGNQIEYSYDEAGDLIDVQFPNGLSSSYRYTAQHYLDAVNPENSVDDIAYTTNFEYDVAGRLMASINANEEATRIAYSLIEGRQIITDAGGDLRIVEYDARGNVTKDIDEVGDVVEMTYDASDNTTSIRTGNNALTTFTYDEQRNMTSLTDPLGLVTSLTYSENNEPLTITDPLGRTVTFGYDERGNQISLSDPTGATGMIEYDEFGRATKAIDVAGRETTFVYAQDIANPTQYIEADGATTSFEYTLYGHVSKLTDSNGNSVEAIRDAMGRLQGTTDALGQSSTIAFTGRFPERQIDHLGRSVEIIYDSVGRVTRVSDADGNPTSYEYDSKGNRTKIIDALGRETITSYRADGLVSAITDDLGNTTSYEYDGAKNVTAIVDANGKRTVFGYDLRGDLRFETDPLGNTTEYVYDDARRITTVIDARGNTLGFQYDLWNNRIATLDDSGNSVVDTYDSVGNMTSRTDRNGNVTTFEYDSRDRLVRQTDAMGGQVLIEYDSLGNRTSITDENGNTTTFEYDVLNRLTRTVNAAGGIQEWQFNDAGLVESFTDEAGRQTVYEYDVLDRLVKAVDPIGNTEEYGYDAIGNRVSFTDKLQQTTIYDHDSLNRVISVTGPSGAQHTFAHDSVGNETSRTDPNGEVWLRTYDDANQLRTITDPLGNTTTFTYDEVGNRTQVVDPLSRVTTNEYNSLNQLVRTIDGLGNSVSFEYDADGNQVLVTDESGNQTSYTYDSLGRVTVRTDALGNSSTTTYDASGNVTSRTDRLGRIIQWSYDERDRVVAEDWFEAGSQTAHFEYEYDHVGNMTAASGPNSTYSYQHDAMNRVIQEDNAGTLGPQIVFNYAYDANGFRTAIEDDANVSVSTEYNSRSLPASVAWSGGGVDDALVQFQYDDRGRIESVDRYSDLDGVSPVVKSTRDYDAKGRLIRLEYTDAVDQLLSQYDFSYDGADQLIGESGHGETKTYGYDLAGQLTSVDAALDPDETYQYDASGNREEAGNTIGTNNRLLADATFDYSYDNEGNLSTKVHRASGETTLYTYDHRNRLTKVQVTSLNGVILSESNYAYDLFDRRIAVSVDPDGDGQMMAETVYTTYDGQNAWADYDGNLEVVARYLFGNRTDQNIARWRPTEGTSWYLTDNRGSVREIANNAGQIVDTISYDSFGNILSESDPSVGDRFKYTGREFNLETGDYYYRARYFNPETGRFLSEDTIGFGGGDYNLYRYVGNAPTNFVDPSGNVGLPMWLVGFGVGGSVGLVTGAINGAICGYFDEWAKVITRNKDAQGRVEPRELYVNLDHLAWERVAFKSAETGSTAALYGGLIGAAFSLFTPPNFLPVAGVAAGFLGGAVPIILQNEKIDQLVENRENRPEELFAHMVCLATEVATGELGGAFAGAVLRNIFKAADAVNPPDVEAPPVTPRKVDRVQRPPEPRNPLPSRLKGDNLANPGARDDIMVIGRQDDTAGFIGEEGHNVLNTGTWNIDVNDGWMLRGIGEGRTFLLASPVNPSTLRSVREITESGTELRETTVFFRELKILRDNGYVRVGDTMVPGPNWVGF